MRSLEALGFVVALIFIASAEGQEVRLDCQVLQPAYRQTLFASLGEAEGLFRTVLELPEGADPVDLVGRVEIPGEPPGPERTLAGVGSGVYDLPFAVGRWVPGEVVLRVVARREGTEVARTEARVRLAAPAADEVVLDSLGVLRVNGTPVFGIGLEGPGVQALETMADQGFGLLWLDQEPVGPEALTASEGRARALAIPPQDDHALASLASSPGLAGWVVSEASPTAYARLLEQDPYHPVFVFEGPGDVLVHSVGAADILAEVQGLISAAARDGFGRPLWCRVPPTRRTAPELEALCLSLAIAGARGLILQIGEEAPEAYKALAARLNRWAPLLRAPYGSTPVRLRTSGLLGSIRTEHFDDFLLLVNPTAAPVAAEFEGIPGCSAVDAETGEEFRDPFGDAPTVPLGPHQARALLLRLADSEGGEGGAP